MGNSCGEEKFDKWIVSLSWDSKHFEMPVGEISPSELYDSDLRAVLLFAREKGFHLVYWAARPECEVSPDILRRFSGLLVDKKVTYERKDEVRKFHNVSESLRGYCAIVEYTKSLAVEPLLSLAVQSGVHSRFNLDPKIPQDKFESMFHVWMQRSVTHDIAEVVFVAMDISGIEQYVGVVTASVEQRLGRIGLLSVLPSYQGKGIGSLLMCTVHQWMQSHDVKETVVVTQQSNIAACQLYARLGYKVQALQHIYHFWVQG